MPKITYNDGLMTNTWYKEIDDYNFNTGLSKNGGVIGHFTAEIWKSVTKVGFGFSGGPSDYLHYKGV